MDYLWLDIVDSFAFTPLSDDPTTSAYRRGKYTIDLLKLNSRDDLVTARNASDWHPRVKLLLATGMIHVIGTCLCSVPFLV